MLALSKNTSRQAEREAAVGNTSACVGEIPKGYNITECSSPIRAASELTTWEEANRVGSAMAALLKLKLH